MPDTSPRSMLLAAIGRTPSAGAAVTEAKANAVTRSIFRIDMVVSFNGLSRTDRAPVLQAPRSCWSGRDNIAGVRCPVALVVAGISRRKDAFVDSARFPNKP